MMRYSELFRTEMRRMRERGWNKIYVFVDLHGTIVPGSYDRRKVLEPYPHALDVLRFLTQDRRFCLVLWTATHSQDLQQYLDMLAEAGVRPDYVNSNPEVGSTELSDFSGKPYFNVLLDDKAGFDPMIDWLELKCNLVDKEEDK